MENKARLLEKDRSLTSKLSIQGIMFKLIQLCKFRAVINALYLNKR